MQVRFSICIGMEVIDDGAGTVLARVSGILIHPDSGKVEGFFVRPLGGLDTQGSFVASIDILTLGTCITVRGDDALCDPADILRLAQLLGDPRTVLGQHMRTQSGAAIGRCADVQFDTKSMHLQWLFPKRWWRWGPPVSVKEIIEVRPEAIILRDPAPLETVEAEQEEPTPYRAPHLADIPEPGVTLSQRNNVH